MIVQDRAMKVASDMIGLINNNAIELLFSSMVLFPFTR
jgi:hypothetical protein